MKRKKITEIGEIKSYRREHGSHMKLTIKNRMKIQGKQQSNF